jgi:hypothetical protein
MRRIALVVVVLGLAVGSASAQQWTEPFKYPNGTNLGTWVEYLGDWNAVNETAESEQKRAYQYLVQPKMVYRDCVVECLVYYNPKSSQKLQFGGVAFRCVSPSAPTSLVHVKVQDNDSSGDFDSIWLYDRPGGAASKTSIKGFLKAKVRLLAIDKRLVAQVDDTGDGLWDHVVTRTSSQTVQSGSIGLCAYGGAQMDDFKVFDGVILDNTSSPKPSPGNIIVFDLRGMPGAPYLAGSSFGNTGIPMGSGRAIPLSSDPLLFISALGLAPTIFAGYSGTMDGSGDANLKVALPNISALVGNTFYTAFFTYGKTGILNLSNDHQVTIVP